MEVCEEINCGEVLEEKQEEIKKRQERINCLVKEESFLFRQYIHQLAGRMEFLKNNGYTYHLEGFVTDKGPILGEDKEKNAVYVFDVDSGAIKVFPRDNMQSAEKIDDESFFRVCNFSKAVSSLLIVLEVQDKFISRYDSEIKQKESSLKKYTAFLQKTFSGTAGGNLSG